jgi:endonuclease/exonuclease/phosphatase family metal-dependent hydrolase
VLENMGFRYHYFYPSASRFEGLFQSGVTILSKYPMIDSGQLSYGKKTAAERLIYTDIKVRDQVFRVFTSHLESVLFQPKDYRGLSQIKNADDSAWEASKNIVSKLKRAYKFRSEQAKIIRQHINDSPFPVIICGDFNDIPNSYTYFKIKGELHDAFLKKGSGIGRTFRHLSPTLRIDYIFADKKFDIKQFTRLKVPYSVHYPIITDLAFVQKINNE